MRVQPKKILYLVAGGAFVVGFIAFLAYIGGFRGGALNMCINQMGTARVRSQVTLEITINGLRQIIPKDIGLGGTCLRPLHTKDETGTISIEAPTSHTFTLGDFFSIWGQPFSEQNLINYMADNTHEIVMMVDDKPSTEFRNLILRDGQKIKLEYRQK